MRGELDAMAATCASLVVGAAPVVEISSRCWRLPFVEQIGVWQGGRLRLCDSVKNEKIGRSSRLEQLIRKIGFYVQGHFGPIQSKFYLFFYLHLGYPRNRGLTKTRLMEVNEATTLTGLHFAATTLMTTTLKYMGYIQTTHLPPSEVVKFVLFANFSIVGMNVSLMWNSVGFYQIAKLSMIPVSCFLEVVLDRVRYSRDTKLSILLVLLGVGVCTVTDVSVNAKGFIAACIAIWSTALQQYYVHHLQRMYSLGSFNLLGHTAPIQAASLLTVGPFLDTWLTNKRVDAYNFTFTAVFFIVLSCVIAIGTNLSQFICIGRFTAVSFQVLGHMKTILVLILGFFFFGKEGLNLHVVAGMVIAIVGMMWYGNASSKPGGKEAWNPLPVSNGKPEEHEKLMEPSAVDDEDDNV